MNSSSRLASKLMMPGLVFLAFLNLSMLAMIGWPFIQKDGEILLTPAAALFKPHLEGEDATPVAANIAIPTPTAETGFLQNSDPDEEGVIILSMSDGAHKHLFAYHPQYLPLTRLSNDAWDEIHPAVNPQGSQVAYSSRQNGYWDLFLLDLASDERLRLTDTPDYDGSPTWSPDGQWLAYESYVDNNLEILILSLEEPEKDAIRLTDGPGADYSPRWSPQGRRIAFVSTTSGEEEIWLASLDEADDRFTNLSQSPASRESSPAWSPDGRYLAWASESNSLSRLVVWDSENPDQPPRPVATGSSAVWNPKGNGLLAEVRAPNQAALGVYALNNSAILYPLVRMSGSLHGFDWKGGQLAKLLQALERPAGADQPAGPLWKPLLAQNPMPPSGRFGVSQLQDVTVSYPYLHDAVDESFTGLRAHIASEAGYDFLLSLENAYLPLTQPPVPGIQENWLYTGRAFAFNPVLMFSGWMAVIREDFSGETYWRVYIKTYFQDGSQGMPISNCTWNLNARYAGDIQAYEKGGQYNPPPEGYWVDFTELASRYGWERLPALSSWRTYFDATRFNQYLLSDGLDWNTAMAELYPPEALVTATYRPTHTRTSTPTSGQVSRDTPAPVFEPTQTPTRRPTFTPAAGAGQP